MRLREWLYLEMTAPTEFPAQIPVPTEARSISAVLKAFYAQAEVYMVGGAVRDYLVEYFHGNVQQYSPKDVDLATNLSEEQILAALRTEVAARQGIRVMEKNTAGKGTFGVVFANVRNSQTIEIAPFRKEAGYDGRRPTTVEQGTAYEDAQRRDFTINSLYYDFDRGVILDFNPGGQGIKDIQDGPRVRPVGDAMERFNEDRLRILRMVRFYSRFRDDPIVNNLDQRTINAVSRFKSLPGITPERILDEFDAGILKSRNTAQFLKNYRDLGLFPAVFPGMKIDLSRVDRLGNSKQIYVILATILHDNAEVGRRLLELKYDRDTADSVQALVDFWNHKDPNNPATYDLIKRRQRLGDKLPSTMIGNYADLMYGGKAASFAHHLAGYQPPTITGQELMQQGIMPGPEMGAEQKRRITAHHAQDYADWLRRRTSGQS